MAATKYQLGHRWGSLVLEERLGTIKSQTRVRCRCDCSGTIDVFMTALTQGGTTHCGDRSQHPHPRQRREHLAYTTVHKRVVKERGSASEQACAHCGKRAQDWAYSNGDLNAVRQDDGREAGLAYSLNPDHYDPLCRPCHHRFDARHRELADGGISLLHVGVWHLRQGISGVLHLPA